jgi:hypothetical protein
MKVTVATVITQQTTQNMEYMRRMLRESNPDFPRRSNCLRTG